MRAVCPATVSILINILSKWECNVELRSIALKCFAKMTIVLHRSSPVERQIDLLTVCQLYLDVIQSLTNTKEFLTRPFDDKFDLSTNDERYIDLNALTSAIDNIKCILSEDQSRAPICYAMIEANFLSILVNIPKQIRQWEFDTQKLAASVVHAIVLLTRASTTAMNSLRANSYITQLFSGVRSLGKPTKALVERCIDLAFNEEKNEVAAGEVVLNLIEWIKDMHMNDQSYVSERLVDICTKNLMR